MSLKTARTPTNALNNEDPTLLRNKGSPLQRQRMAFARLPSGDKKGKRAERMVTS
jgi:hypothetical protein